VVLGRGGRVGPISDPEIRAYALATFNEEFTLEPDAHIAHMRRHGERVAIGRTAPDGSEKIDYFDYVLAATGRTPNVKGIGLENTTLKLDSKGVPSFDPLTTRTVNADGTSPILIAGDTSNFIPLLHEAADEGRIAGGNAARLALGKQVNPGLRRAPIGVVFTDPQIGIVGGGFHSMKPGTFATGQVSFEDQGRSRILLVGHQPDLGELASVLVWGSPTAGISFKKAGVARIVTANLPPAATGELRWLLTPKQLLMIAGEDI